MHGKPAGRPASKVISALGALLLLTAMACAPTAATDRPNTPASATFPMTIADDAGRTVTLKAQPQKIVSLAPSNTEILYALDLGERIVGVDKYSDYPPQAQEKERVGDYATPSIEKVVALAPGLVLAAQIHQASIVPELERRGLVVVVLAPPRVEGVLDNIRLVGKMTGHASKAEEVAAALEKRIADVTAKTQSAPKRRVFFELSKELITVGPNTFIDDLIAKAGGQNIASSAKTPWPQLGSEALIVSDPQVIILADHVYGETPEGVKARPGWQGISAVKQGRIIALDPNLTNRPGPRVVDGLEQMAKAIHPELFP